MARWILHSSIMRLLHCAGMWLLTRAGRRCLDASSRRYKRVLRRGPGRDLEESFKFQVSTFHFLFSIFVRCEPAAAEEKARAKRGEKDGTTMAAWLLRSAPQRFVEGCATGGRAEVAGNLRDRRKSVRRDTTLFCEKSNEARIWLVRRKTAD